MGLDAQLTQMQVKDLLAAEGISPDALRMRFNRLGLEFRQERIMTAAELAIYRAQHPEAPKKNTPTAPEVTPATTTPRNKPTTQDTKPTTKPATRLQVGIYDLLMWADWTLGTYSLTIIFGPLAGLLVGLKTTLFGEATRRMMRRSPIAIPEYGHPNYQAATDQAEALRRTKAFVSSISVALSLLFCWANGQTFYRSILVNTPDLTHTNLADYAARTFAVAVTLISLSSMYALALQARTQPNKHNGK